MATNLIHKALETIKTDAGDDRARLGRMIDISRHLTQLGPVVLAQVDKLDGGDGSGMRIDSSLPIAARQLEHVYAEVLQAEYPDLPAAEGLIAFIDTSVDPGAKTWTQYMLDGTSTAAFISDAATSLPTVMLTGAEISGNTQMVGNQMAWTLDDMLTAAKAGQQLEAPLRELAGRAHAHAFHRTCLWGAPSLGVHGFLGHPNINMLTSAANGTDSSTDWRDKTYAQIAADVSSLIAAVRDATKRIRNVTNILMSPRVYTYLHETLVGTSAPGKTMLMMLRETYAGGDRNVNGGQAIQFGTLAELDYTYAAEELAADDLTNTTKGVDINSTTGDVVMAYCNRREVVSFIRPKDFTPEPVQVHGLTWSVPCWSKVGGAKIPEPLAIARMEGVRMPD